MRKALYSNVSAIENGDFPLEVSSFFHEFHDFVIASSRKPLYSKLFARVDWLHICLYTRTRIYVYRRIYAYIGVYICVYIRV